MPLIYVALFNISVLMAKQSQWEEEMPAPGKRKKAHGPDIEMAHDAVWNNEPLEMQSSNLHLESI